MADRHPQLQDEDESKAGKSLTPSQPQQEPQPPPPRQMAEKNGLVRERSSSSFAAENKLRRRPRSRDYASSRTGTDNIEWPQWNTLRRRERFCLLGWRMVPSQPIHFNLRIEPNVHGYSEEHLQSIHNMFNDTRQCLFRIRSRLYMPNSDYGSKLQRLVARGITMATYGSNLIDKSGCTFLENLTLCQAVLANDRLMYDGLSPDCDEYKANLEAIIRSGVEESAFRRRREVVNHMAAFCHMANNFVGQGQPFSEKLIKETHRILCRDLDKIYVNDVSTKSSKFAGLYRKEDVFANTFKFPPHQEIRSMMRKFVRLINATISQAEKAQELDPFFFASSASAHFVNIHPFLSGNGRICRIILNVILLKYAGIALAMGGDEKERRSYLTIAAQRTHTGKGDGEMSRFLLLKANRTMKVIERALAPDG